MQNQVDVSERDRSPFVSGVDDVKERFAGVRRGGGACRRVRTVSAFGVGGQNCVLVLRAA
jgi:hypothetical protein